MKALSLILDKCIVQYKTCFAGDVRTGLCLRDAGILLQKIPGFNKQPPQLTRGIHPCQKPITFHHLLVKQIQEIWDLESKYLSSNNTITFSDMYEYFIGKQEGEEYMIDTDLPGNDIMNISTPSAIYCQKLCQNEPECVSFSFVNGVCWLKDSIPFTKQANKSVSGIFQERYKCQL